MVVTESGIVILVKESQKEKAEFPIVVTEFTFLVAGVGQFKYHKGNMMLTL